MKDNIFEYLKWRDDIEFDKLNEIDALIFSRIAYFPVEKIIKKNEKVTILEAYKRSLKLSDLSYTNKYDRSLFKKLSNSIRYKNLYIGNIVEKFSILDEEQFMAITIYLPDNYVFVSFRGTTLDIVGWKEDFNMSYKIVPSQIHAADYLNNFSLDFHIYMGGHSKGGNLAIYALSKANDNIKERVIKVYNFDGPGLLESDDDYEMIYSKIITYLPSDSVVGRLLDQNNEKVIVKSSIRGIKSHDVYTWQIEKNYFILSKLSLESDIIKNVIDEFLSKVSYENRELFICDIYDIINRAGIKKINDLNINDLKNLILSYKKLDENEKKLLFTIIRYLFDSTKGNIKIDEKKS